MSYYYPEALSGGYPAATYTWEQTPTEWSSMGRELDYNRPSDLWDIRSRELDYDRPSDLWGMRELGFARPSDLWGMRPRELAPMEDRSLWQGGMEMGGMATAGMGMGMWQPRCTVRATDGGMLIEASLPGVKLEDIELRLIEGDLILSGERREEKSHKDEGYWSREMSYGKFRRRLWLPEGVQLDQIKANFNNGVLQVLVPLPGRERRGRMELGQGEGKQTYMEWGGAQAQPMADTAALRQEERAQPMGERGYAAPRQEEQAPMGERLPTIQRQEEAGPISEAGTKEERKPLLEKKDKEREPLVRRGSGIFIGDEAPTTGESTV